MRQGGSLCGWNIRSTGFHSLQADFQWVIQKKHRITCIQPHLQRAQVISIHDPTVFFQDLTKPLVKFLPRILDSYNERMEEEGKEDQVITYTDIVGTMTSSVTDIIDIISYVLIAFVAISLVVSSIMIGVITYISVLERKKEIGILRAIGASKRNVSQVFNAETFIIGLCSGLLGIGLTLLLMIPRAGFNCGAEDSWRQERRRE